jgi:hypothetical protein
MSLHTLWIIARCVLVVFVAASVLIFRYLERFHKIDHKTIYNAEYKHDELDSYTYFRVIPSGFHGGDNKPPRRDAKLVDGGSTFGRLFGSKPRQDEPSGVDSHGTV